MFGRFGAGVSAALWAFLEGAGVVELPAPEPGDPVARVSCMWGSGESVEVVTLWASQGPNLVGVVYRDAGTGDEGSVVMPARVARAFAAATLNAADAAEGTTALVFMPRGREGESV